MPSKMGHSVLEKRLAEIHQRKFCVLVSRATTAIYLALKALPDDGRRKVVLPALMCASPSNAVIYAGFEPVFCDISLKDFNIDPKALERILSGSKDIFAVLVPHNYGQPTDLDRLLLLAKKYNVNFIEDAAQAQGGFYKGKPLGAFGALSVLSFGHTKILDAGEGGALLFDDKKYLNEIQEHYQSLEKKGKNFEALKDHYRDVYYDLARLTRKHNSFYRLYYAFPFIFKSLYLYRGISPETEKHILVMLDGLKAQVARRRENAEIYAKLLAHPQIRKPQYNWDGVYWRYSFLIEKNGQHAIAEDIRSKGIDVSNWYPSVHRLYRLEPAVLKNAEYADRHIFNLWVDFRGQEKNVALIARKVIESCNVS